MKDFAKPENSPPPPQGQWDVVARVYFPLEKLIFGDDMQAARRQLIDWTPDAGRAVIIGEGDGRLLTELVGQRPDLHVTVLEPSPGMRREISGRLAPGAEERVSVLPLTWQQALEQQPAPFDSQTTVLLPFILDLHEEPDVARLAAALARHQVPALLVAEFTVPSRESLNRLRARVILGALYRTARWLTGLQTRSLPDYPAILQNHGFSCPSPRIFSNGLIQACRFLRDP